MAQTQSPRTVAFASATERRRLQQVRLAQHRAELAEVRRRAADSVAAIDAELGAVDREIAIILAAVTLSDGKAPTAGSSARGDVARNGATRRSARSESASRPAPGTTSDTIARLLARRATQTFTPTQIRDATGINSALVMKTLQRMHTRRQVIRVAKGAYKIAPKK